MDTPKFVQNIKMYCKLRGVKPTIAMRESGVGTSFINNIEKGSAPSVFKVQQLAAYLNVTTSELLGETVAGEDLSPLPDILVKFSALSPDDQDEIMAIIEYKSNKNRR